MRSQRLAFHAYECVRKVAEADPKGKEYKIAVNDLAANILRVGLSAALAVLERQRGERGGILLEQLASANVAGLEGASRDNLAERIRQLDVDAYMIATREMLQLAAWLKRAAQATFEDD